MTIVIASNNAHKIQEFARIVPEHKIVAPAFFGIRFAHEETGDSFIANALGKAQTMYRMLQTAGENLENVAVVADDSGLVVPALGGEPGIYSARYGSTPGGPELNDDDRNGLLLANMTGIDDRSAYYICCMVLMLGEERFASAQETWHGVISRRLSPGTTGFGYDPLFMIPELDKAVADIGEDLKARISHRAKATMLLLRNI